MRVVTEGVERAAKGFVRTHGAALGAQMVAAGFDAHGTQFFLFFGGEGDFKRWVARFNVAAFLAFGTVVKQHAPTP